MARMTPSAFVAAAEQLHVVPFVEVKGRAWGLGWYIAPAWDHVAIHRAFAALCRRFRLEARRDELAGALAIGGRFRRRR